NSLLCSIGLALRSLVLFIRFDTACIKWGGVALATPEFSGVSGFACGKNLDVSSPFSNWYT
ncbi:MAG: hypothetical protein PHS36_02725, partial [Candidatus Cloacimonetes bacterium]|nr:hypothetical protein [Candidatus Cloacimonadota bacterium]